MSEKSYLRDLHMITKVFREQIQKIELASNTELDAIFSNINDIAELTITLIGSLEVIMIKKCSPIHWLGQAVAFFPWKCTKEIW